MVVVDDVLMQFQVNYTSLSHTLHRSWISTISRICILNNVQFSFLCVFNRGKKTLHINVLFFVFVSRYLRNYKPNRKKSHWLNNKIRFNLVFFFLQFFLLFAVFNTRRKIMRCNGNYFMVVFCMPFKMSLNHCSQFSWLFVLLMLLVLLLLLLTKFSRILFFFLVNCNWCCCCFRYCCCLWNCLSSSFGLFVAHKW